MRKRITKIMVYLMLSLFAVSFTGQALQAQTLNLDQVQSETKKAAKTGVQIAKWATIVAVFAGGVIVAYVIITGHPKQRDYIIGVLLTLVVIAIIWTVVPAIGSGG